MTWREKFRPIIAAVIAANPGADPATLRKLCGAAWPAGLYERRHHPYKIFCDEIRAQLGTKRTKMRAPKQIKPPLALLEREGQGKLFEVSE